MMTTAYTIYDKIKDVFKTKKSTETEDKKQSIDIEPEEPSAKKCFYTPETTSDTIDYIKSLHSENELGMLSEYGWLFLINDSNDFIDYAYGKKKWAKEDRQTAINILDKREQFFSDNKISYFKFIIPEKLTIYSEYVPKRLSDLDLFTERPAKILADARTNIFYLHNYLWDLKSYGPIYFRRDTHTNWLGSFYAYLYVIEKITKAGIITKDHFTLDDMLPQIAKYQGDLFHQMNPQIKADLFEIWKSFNLSDGLSYDIQYLLKDEQKIAQRVKADDFYEKYSEKRDLFIYETQDSSLPVCVIFRDSTADFMVELLAQHFSRSVFIWHGGNVYEEIIEREKPDIVIHLMAERFVSDYPTSKVPYVSK